MTTRIEGSNRTGVVVRIITKIGGALGANASAQVQGRSEDAVAAPLHFDHALRLEDGLAFAEELALVSGRQHQGGNDCDADPRATRVENPQLRQKRQIADALVIGLIMKIVVGAVDLGVAAIVRAIGSARIEGRGFSTGNADGQRYTE